MKSKILLGLGTATLLAAVLPAQTSVLFPKGFDRVEGSSSAYSASSGAPWSISTTATSRVFRNQLVIDLDPTVKGKVSGIVYRRDGTLEAGQAMSGVWAELEVNLSTAATTSSSISTTFASNIGSDAVNVVAKKKVNFSPAPYIGMFPEPFLVRLPFDSGRSLAYDGSKGSLMIEFIGHDNNLYDAVNSKSIYWDLDRAYNSTSAPYLSLGQGEAWSLWKPGMNHYQYMYVSGGNLQLYSYVNYAKPQSVVAWITTLDGLVPKAGNALPNGSPWYLDLGKMIDLQATIAGDDGYARFPASGYHVLPYDKSWAGINLDGQCLSIDPTTSEMWSSNAYRRQVPLYDANGSIPAASVYKSGATAHTDATGYSGGTGYSPVMKLELL
ncbi:MAG: hypothetical protein R3F30_15505 [Planctomycetota bacterium]